MDETPQIPQGTIRESLGATAEEGHETSTNVSESCITNDALDNHNTIGVQLPSDRENTFQMLQRHVDNLYKEAGLSNETVQFLKDQGFNDIRSIKMIREKDIDEMNLLLGEKAKIRALVEELKLPSEKPPPYSSLPPDEQELKNIKPQKHSPSDERAKEDGSSSSLISKPGQPIQIKVTHNSISIMWSPPAQGLVSSYVVSFKKVSDDFWTEVPTTTSSFQHTVHDLDGGTKYFFKVQALESTCCSPFSECSDVMETITPPSAPGEINVQEITHTSVVLTWEKPQTSAELVKQYRIVYKKTGTEDWLKEDSKDALCKYELFGLDMGTSYNVEVQPFWDGGLGSSISSVDITTLQRPEAPGKPFAKDVSCDTITIKWEPPKFGEEYISCYEIQVETINNTYVQTKKTKKLETSLRISGLKEATGYVCRVRGCWAHGNTSFSEASQVIVTLATKPGKPSAMNIHRTHESVKLEWRSCSVVSSEVEDYKVEYKDINDTESTWSTVDISGNTNSEDIFYLNPGTSYRFRVKAIYKEKDKESSYSDYSDIIQTLPTSSPAKPTASQISLDKIKVTWQKPAAIGEKVAIVNYIIEVTERRKTNRADSIYIKHTKGDELELELNGTDGKEYSFRVAANCGTTGKSEMSDPCEFISFQASVLDKKKNVLVNQCPKLFTKNMLDIYKVPLKDVYIENGLKICIKEFGTLRTKDSKAVILVVGGTGAGKTTFINGLVNHLFGVSWKDNFRFKLIHEETGHAELNEAMSQTKWITAYTLHCVKFHDFKHTLTIIDTPGFGDTSGIKQDKQLLAQITRFFHELGNRGIDYIHAVGFVVQASLPRLTPTQMYIFESILSLFGKDMEKNIALLITFADAQEPPVLASIREAQIPKFGHFKFNNSALFVDNKSREQDDVTEFNKKAWEMGTKSFDIFLRDLLKLNPQSIFQSSEVLEERNYMEKNVDDMEKAIQKGLHTLEKIRFESDLLKIHEKDIAENKDFEYEDFEYVDTKVYLENGEYIKYCERCKCICDDPNEKEIDTSSEMCGMKCANCPGKCLWIRHSYNNYRIEKQKKTVRRTYSELKAKYDMAKGKILDIIEWKDELKKDFRVEQFKVLSLTNQVRKSTEKLSQIALRPNPYTNLDYLDTLIEAAKHERKDGWLEYKKELEEIRQKAEHIQSIINDQGNFDPFEEYMDLVNSGGKEAEMREFEEFLKSRCTSLQGECVAGANSE